MNKSDNNKRLRGARRKGTMDTRTRVADTTRPDARKQRKQKNWLRDLEQEK